LRFAGTVAVLEVRVERTESKCELALDDTMGELVVVSIELRVAEEVTAGVILELDDAGEVEV
jgi:hypothetical protein